MALAAPDAWVPDVFQETTPVVAGYKKQLPEARKDAHWAQIRGGVFARALGYPALCLALLIRDYYAGRPKDHRGKGFVHDAKEIVKHGAKVFVQTFNGPSGLGKKHRLLRLAVLATFIESWIFVYRTCNWGLPRDFDATFFKQDERVRGMKDALKKDLPRLKKAMEEDKKWQQNAIKRGEKVIFLHDVDLLPGLLEETNRVLSVIEKNDISAVAKWLVLTQGMYELSGLVGS